MEKQVIFTINAENEKDVNKIVNNISALVMKQLSNEKVKQWLIDSNISVKFEVK